MHDGCQNRPLAARAGAGFCEAPARGAASECKPVNPINCRNRAEDQRTLAQTGARPSGQEVPARCEMPHGGGPQGSVVEE